MVGRIYHVGLNGLFCTFWERVEIYSRKSMFYHNP